MLGLRCLSVDELSGMDCHNDSDMVALQAMSLGLVSWSLKHNKKWELA